MTLFFPDLNVWLALSVADHTHNREAWSWLDLLPGDGKLIFSRYTQLGFLRLLSNQTIMGAQTVTLGNAWQAYERWLSDPRVEFYPEPRGFDHAFREATRPFLAQMASKWVGDCYLLAFAKQSTATLVTFDKALAGAARKQGHAAIIPA